MGADPITKAVGSGMDLYGDSVAAYGAEKAADETGKKQMQMNREQIAEQGREFDITSQFQKETQAAREAAYKAALAQGRTDLDSFGGQAMTEFDAANPELETMESDIASGNAKALQQGAGQMEANLAAAGVRGGQAATLLNRGTGEQAIESQKNMNELKYSDAATRAAEKRAYLAALARSGQAAGNAATGVSI